MYKLKDSFMEYVGYSEDSLELEKLHIENIKDYWLHSNKTTMIDVNIQVLEGESGYVYCGGKLITFKNNITGMTEYKVWEDL